MSIRSYASDSCISQHLSIVHKIQASFDYKPPTDIRAIFLEISKVFDKVWYQGLLFKWKSYRVEGNFWDFWKTSFITENKEWYFMVSIHPGKFLSVVRQDCVLGPLPFLIYINNLPNGLISICLRQSSWFPRKYRDKN